MKTLDEVIDNFEKACDLERRCEDCSGCLGQEYGCPNDGAECVPDALHYLKEYRDYRNSDKTVTENGCVSDAENDPLTWEELREMEWKPVWVETKRYGSRWYLVEDNTYEDMIVFTGLFGEIAPYFQEDFGKTWQAYRKERNEDIR